MEFTGKCQRLWPDREKKFLEIKQAYRDVEKKIKAEKGGSVFETEKGIFGSTDCDDIFDFFKKIKLSHSNRFIDLGSGDGRVVLTASLFADSTGVEADEELNDAAIQIRNRLDLSATFIGEDYLRYDLSSYDFVFINPDKEFSKGLDEKLAKELKDRIFVYSNVFLPNKLKKGKTFWIKENKIISYTKK